MRLPRRITAGFRTRAQRRRKTQLPQKVTPSVVVRTGFAEQRDAQREHPRFRREPNRLRICACVCVRVRACVCTDECLWECVRPGVCVCVCVSECV